MKLSKWVYSIVLYCLFAVAIAASYVSVIQPEPMRVSEAESLYPFLATSLTVAPQNLLLVARDNQLRGYSLESGEQVKFYRFEQTRRNCGLAGWNRHRVERINQGRFLVVQVDCQIISLEAGSFSNPRVLLNFKDFNAEPYIYNFTISPDGQLIAAATNWCYTCVWDVATGRLVSQIKPTNATWTASDMTFSTDSQTLAVGADVIWSRKNNQSRFSKNNDNAGRRVHFSPDGKSIFVAGQSKYAKKIEVATGEILIQYNHTIDADTIAFSPNGQYVVTASLNFKDRKIRMFNAVSGKQIKIFEGSKNPILDLAFTNDSRYFISSESDSTIRIWKIQ
jgi:WD40 repeat protein